MTGEAIGIEELDLGLSMLRVLLRRGGGGHGSANDVNRAETIAATDIRTS